jgi:hypothetical protein
MVDMVPGMSNGAIEAFLARAASIGVEAKQAEAQSKAQVDSDARAAADARELARDSKRRASGFRRPMFRALSEVAAAFESSSNNFGAIPETFKESVASRAAQTFAASYTGRTEKSAKGGVTAGWTHVIFLGRHGRTLIEALADRVDHWQKIADEPVTDEASAALRDTALRYVTPAASCPAPDGRTEPGKPPKHNGRAPVTLTVMGKAVALPYRGATNRDAILAEAARLARTHGIEIATHPFVIDAVLDNGGRWRKPEGDVQGFAAEALSALDKILSMGGAESLDGASLMVMRDVVHRIAQQGLRERPVILPEALDDAGDDAGDDTGDDTETVDSSDAGASDAAPDSAESVPARKPRKKAGI